MKKWFARTAIFIIVYIVFAIALMPASFVVQYIKVPNNISIQGLSGTIWQSHITQIQHLYGEVNNINASLSFWSLFTLNPSLKLTFGDALSKGPEGQATISGLLSNIVIKQTNISLSANELVPHLQLPIPLTAEGFVDLNITHYQMGQPYCQGLTGQLTWPKATVNAANEQIKLGDLAADLNCEQGTIAAVIQPKNNLGLSYSAYLQQGGRFNGNGYLTPGAGFPEALKNVLPFLGQPDGQGRYRL